MKIEIDVNIKLPNDFMDLLKNFVSIPKETISGATVLEGPINEIVKEENTITREKLKELIIDKTKIDRKNSHKIKEILNSLGVDNLSALDDKDIETVYNKIKEL